MVDTFGSTYDTILAVHTGACGSLVESSCSDDAPESLQSEIVLAVTGGVTYHIEVASFNALSAGGGETLAFNVAFEELP
jgi:hypothetical protein